MRFGAANGVQAEPECGSNSYGFLPPDLRVKKDLQTPLWVSISDLTGVQATAADLVTASIHTSVLAYMQAGCELT